jgi:hypothetical protein
VTDFPRPRQKKVAAKFDNLLNSLADNHRPSLYTLEAFRVLDAKGRVTQAELRNIFTLDGYSDATAKAEANQTAMLFKAVGIAMQVNDNLWIVKDSEIAKRLRAYL